MRKARLLAATGAIASIGVIAVLPAPAQAHQTCMFHNNDSACVYSYSHETIQACDGEQDGHRVRAQYYVYYSIARQYGNWDSYGPGCAYNYAPNLGITQYRICEEEVSCSAWKYNP